MMNRHTRSRNRDMAKGNPLQEQLLKAGLVKKGKVAEIAREQTKARHGKQPTAKTESQREVERVRQEKAERDRALHLARDAATNRPSGPNASCPMSKGSASDTSSPIRTTSTTNLCHCCHGQCQAPPSPRHQSITAPTRLSSSTAPPHHAPPRFQTPLPTSDPWHHPLRCHVLSLCHQQQQSSPYHSSAA